MYHKCKPDSSGLNIIADTTLYEISSCSVLYLYFPDLHCQFWYFNIIFLYSFFLLFLSYLNFFFTQAVKTILHFNPEREHLDSEEATVFFPFVTAKNKTVASKRNKLCLFINEYISQSLFHFIDKNSHSFVINLLHLYYWSTQSMTAPIICDISPSFTDFTHKEHRTKEKMCGRHWGRRLEKNRWIH